MAMFRAIAAVLMLQFAASLAAQEKSADQKEFRGQDAQRVDAWLKVSQDHAADYRLAPKDQPDKPLKLLPQAVFRHSQPVRGDDIGAVYLWVDDAGLPAALGTVFAYSYGDAGERWVAHEFHSLAATPLVGTWRGEAAWSPAEPGVAWKEVPDSPAPAKIANARLRQMRDIGRRMTAHSTDASGGRWELRLITQPIHQYTAEKSDAIGGGVFLFCQGTDPEVILLLEARPGRDRPAWHYALAPFTDYGLSVTLGGTEVWSLDRNHRATRTTPHWWNGRMEVKRLTAEEEAELAKAFRSQQPEKPVD
jgi:hypothetical protein